MANQKVPDGWYHLDRMVNSTARHGADVGSCGTCLDAHSIPDDLLSKSAHRSTLDELAECTLWADRS